MKTLFSVTLSGSWFDSSGGIDYESSVSIDSEGKIIDIESCPENRVDVNKTWKLTT
jgi:hypothetical protein